MDLTSDAGWPEAVAGCHYVLHVASPYPINSPRDENELVSPALTVQTWIDLLCRSYAGCPGPAACSRPYRMS